MCHVLALKHAAPHLFLLQGLGLVFVAVYQKALSLTYVEDLLQAIKDAFLEDYTPGSYNYSQFSAKFAQILRDCETRADKARSLAAQPKAAAAPAAAKAAKGSGQAGKGVSQVKAYQIQMSSEDPSSDADDAAASSAAGGSGEGSAGSDEEQAAANGNASGGGFNLDKLKGKGLKAVGPGGRRNAAAARRAYEEAKQKEKEANASPAKKKKVRTCLGMA